jgi:hypothetical protein
VIAVAAVFVSKKGKSQVPPVASILSFDFGGHLVSAFAMRSYQEVTRLAVDESGNIWTLTANSDGRDPASVPMVIEYSPDGLIVGEFLNRSMFPLHATSTRENSRIGAVWMGYDSGILWFWLPGSTELVTIATQNSSRDPVILKTGLPVRTNQSPPNAVFREASGNIVAEFREINESGTRITYFRWTATTNSWAQYGPGNCDGRLLTGIRGGEQVFAGSDGSISDACRYGNGPPSEMRY